MINIAMFFLLLALLAWAVTMTVLCFTCDCKQNNSDKQLEMNESLGSNGCNCGKGNSDKPLGANGCNCGCDCGCGCVKGNVIQQDANLSMPNCSSTEEWSKCMNGQGTVKGCMPLHKGLMPKGNAEEGCWVKDGEGDNDPCMYFLEGGPSPNMAPTDCNTVCCTGGSYVKK